MDSPRPVLLVVDGSRERQRHAAENIDNVIGISLRIVGIDNCQEAKKELARPGASDEIIAVFVNIDAQEGDTIRSEEQYPAAALVATAAVVAGIPTALYGSMRVMAGDKYNFYQDLSRILARSKVPVKLCLWEHSVDIMQAHAWLENELRVRQ